jgi:hypothetical protein
MGDEMLRVAITSCGFLLAAGSAWSQNCDSIIVHGLRNVSVSQSEESSTALKYFNRCEVNVSSYTDEQLTSAEVEVFGYGSGGGTYSRAQREERINNWCQTNKDVALAHKSSLQSSQTIYQGAVSAWETCVRLASRDIQIIPIIAPDARTVDIGIVYKGSGDSGVRLTGIVADGFTCESRFPEGGAEVTFPYVVGPRAVQVHCTRAASEQRVLQNEPFDVLPRATISVQTASDPFQLYFPEEWTPPAPLSELAKLTERVNTLQSRIQILESEVVRKEEFSKLKEDINGSLADLRKFVPKGKVWGWDIQGTTSNQEDQCDAGQFLTGINTYLEDGHIKMGFHCEGLPLQKVP